MKFVSFLFLITLSVSAFSSDDSSHGQTSGQPCLRSAESNDRTPVTDKSDEAFRKKQKKASQASEQ